MNQAGLTYNGTMLPGRVAAGIETGNLLPGDYATGQGLGNQDPIHPNLSVGEAQAQRQRDFGLGASNNAQTAAMIGQAQATGNKYSGAFGDIASQAGAASAAAGARGTDMYAGNTSAYAQGLANAQQSRGMQTDSYQNLLNFANQGPGPSAAQAQLAQATDANTQNALSLARSGRGMGGSQAALRQAIAQNATTQQTANSQAAELRANENTAYQQQRLSALGAAGTVAGQTVSGDQSYGQLGLSGAQYQTNTALQGTQLNDAASQAWAAQQQSAMGQGLGAEVGAQTQGLNINSTALAGRENEYSSANQTYATQQGLAQNASIADANRQQAYFSGGVSAGATVLGALSDERYKTNIIPLSGNGIAPLPSQSGGSVQGAPTSQPVKIDEGAAKGNAVGGTVGGAAGGIAGGAVAGPVGAVVGSVAGKVIGSTIGKLVGSDVRNKTNIQPLSDKYVEPLNAAGGGLGPNGEYLHGNFAAGRRKLDTDAFGSRQIDTQNPYEQLQALASKYGASGVAETPKAVTQYAKDKPRSAERRFARDESHPILSEGDALLADSARNAPGAAYEYKDPNSPGARPGMQTGPMAQDLASHPLTAGMVGKDQATGKLFVDGSRAAMTGLAQNHSQQNQLDALALKTAELESLLKRKPGDDRATSFAPAGTGGL